MNISFRDLTVYKKAFSLAMEIFEISKKFPVEEKFGLTSQIRNSSRSVCSSVAEAYRKRKYPAHFISKISDADMENSETQVWLDFSLECKYIDSKLYKDLLIKSEEV
ncbi:MAG: four helix bundle protein [Ignavibacteria bacterium]|nr:four helix bundle protein [Ignavibacteria bacterium]